MLCVFIIVHLSLIQLVTDSESDFSSDGDDRGGDDEGCMFLFCMSWQLSIIGLVQSNSPLLISPLYYGGRRVRVHIIPYCALLTVYTGEEGAYLTSRSSNLFEGLSFCTNENNSKNASVQREVCSL